MFSHAMFFSYQNNFFFFKQDISNEMYKVYKYKIYIYNKKCGNYFSGIKMLRVRRWTLEFIWIRKIAKRF